MGAGKGDKLIENRLNEGCIEREGDVGSTKQLASAKALSIVEYTVYLLVWHRTCMVNDRSYVEERLVVCLCIFLRTIVEQADKNHDSWRTRRCREPHTHTTIRYCLLVIPICEANEHPSPYRALIPSSIRKLSSNAETLSCTTNCPEQIRIQVSGGCYNSAVRKNLF